MVTISSIKRLHRVIDRSLFFTDGNLDYARITDGLITLANAVNAYDGEFDDIVNIGESDTGTVSDTIVGAYWHYAARHAGQWSKEYAALSALGGVFSPGVSNGPERDTSEHCVFDALEGMAPG